MDRFEKIKSIKNVKLEASILKMCCVMIFLFILAKLQ